LRRHVTLMGMTGSGKSTTAAVIVRQVASMGLPVMVLDWHNEHGNLVKSVGGQVLSPGKDEFAINPLDLGPATEPSEHIEMVTDIFSDTYHFTHPQVRQRDQGGIAKEIGPFDSRERGARVQFSV
jgi:hypothetical protein